MILSAIRHPVGRFVIRTAASAVVYEGGKRLASRVNEKVHGLQTKIFTPTQDPPKTKARTYRPGG